MSADGSDGPNYDSRDGKRHGRGHSYSAGYGGSSDFATNDSYGSYGGSQVSFYCYFLTILLKIKVNEYLLEGLLLYLHPSFIRFCLLFLF